MNKILLIDSDGDVAEVAAEVLSLFDYEVTAINSITDIVGLEWDRYALVLIDWAFPEIGGMAIYEKVMQGGYAGKVIMLSARSLSNDQRLRFEQKGIKFLAKPFSCVELSSAVEKTINQ